MVEKNCPTCSTENPKRANYCMNCGQGLQNAPTCPRCAKLNSWSAIYCCNCGLRLGKDPSQTQAETIIMERSQLGKYIPKELLDKWKKSHYAAGMPSERRIISILFCDVQGSTAMAEMLDPEEWTEVMLGTFECLVPPIYEYEGIVARLMGDGMLAFFGAPTTHEDDAERAVLAGLEILERISKYREEIKETRDLEIHVRIGIHTGLVVVGEVGADLRVEYTAMGDAINLASRLEQTAPQDGIQISQSTYDLIEKRFSTRPLGEKIVKGKKKSLLTYQVLGRIPQSNYSSVKPEWGPLLGREKEMSLLRNQLTEIQSGKGGVLCLIGDAGVGKSRLIDELRKDWESRVQQGVSGYWSDVPSVSFGAKRPYAQFLHHLRAISGSVETDSPEMVYQRLERVVGAFSDELRQPALDIYRRVLGLESSSSRLGNQTNTEGKVSLTEKMYDVIMQMQRRIISGVPSVFVFEELHHIDRYSMEMLSHFFQMVEDTPLLFLLSFRPDPHSNAWLLRDIAKSRLPLFYKEIELAPLSEADSLELLKHYGNFPQDMIRQILHAADGNPLYIREMASLWLERKEQKSKKADSNDGQLGEHELPGSLQSLVNTRLDQLDEALRHLIQIAAVIGYSFPLELLRRSVGENVGFDEKVEKLIENGIIYRARETPEQIFRFRQALIREVAYHSITKKHRREIQRQVEDAKSVSTLSQDQWLDPKY
jgi:class 3 adenylate cyclase